MLKKRSVIFFFLIVVSWLGLSSILPAVSLAANKPEATVVDSQHMTYDNGGGSATYTEAKEFSGDGVSFFKEGDLKTCGKSHSNAPLRADDTKGMVKYVDEFDYVIRDVDIGKKTANYIVYQYALFAKTNDLGGYQQVTKSQLENSPNQKFGFGSGSYRADCIQAQKVAITLITTNNSSNADYRWIDAGYIQKSDGQKRYYDDNADKRFDWTADTGGCKEFITVKTIGSTVGVLHHSGPDKNVNGTCDDSKYETRNITIADPVVDGKKSSTLAAKTGKDLDGKTSEEAKKDEATKEEDNSCESKGAVLGWIICPVLDFMDKTVTALDGAIQNILSVPDAYVNNPDVAAIAGRMRNLAYVVLIPIMLVMVIGTALGYEVVSAYTVKKALPRLAVAVIFIALAFPLCQFLIGLTNDVGGGIHGFITSQVRGEDGKGIGDFGLKDIFHPDGQSVVTSIGVSAAAGGIAFASGIGTGIILSYLFVALIGILVGFLLLSFRQFFLIALMLLAPLAILSWIFPSNDKMWKLWWGTFSKLLLLFPLIMVLIASGKVFAFIVSKTSSSGTAATLIAIIAYIGPYFLIPKMFQLAGGAFASIAGMANNRSKGLFDRQRKYRGQKMGENREKIKDRERFSDRNRLTKGLNKFGAGIAQGPSGAFGLSQKGKANIERRVTARTAERLKEPGVNEMLMDDEVRGVLAVGKDKADAFLAAKGIKKDDPNTRDQYNQIMGAAKSVGFTSSSRLAALQGETTHGKGRNMEAITATYGAGTDQNLGMEEFVKDIAGSVGMDSTGTERLMQNSMYNFGSNSRADLRQKTVADVMDKKFDASLLRGISDTAMGSLAGATVDRLQTGSITQKAQAASQLLAMHENRSGMSQPALDKLDTALTTAGVDLGSRESVNMQLAKLANPTVAPSYDITKDALEKAQGNVRGLEQKRDDEVARTGNVTPATDGALMSARTAYTTASAAHKPHKDIIDDYSQGISATAATYSQGTPEALRGGQP